MGSMREGGSYRLHKCTDVSNEVEREEGEGGYYFGKSGMADDYQTLLLLIY